VSQQQRDALDQLLRDAPLDLGGDVPFTQEITGSNPVGGTSRIVPSHGIFLGRPGDQRADPGHRRGHSRALADSSRSRVTIEVDFTGHGMGRLLVPLVVRRQAASEMPDNMKRLKQRLEASRLGGTRSRGWGRPARCVSKAAQSYERLYTRRAFSAPMRFAIRSRSPLGTSSPGSTAPSACRNAAAATR
jgi:hypothetical protein